MNRSIVRYLGLTLVLILALLTPILILAQAHAPPITHDLDGLDDCLSCHETGADEAGQMPDDHAGRTNYFCERCHLPAGEAAPADQGSTIPFIPHPLEGRDDCLVCHETGVVGATQILDNHVDWSDDVCQSCHQLPSSVPAVPHPLEGRDDCLACHETGVAGASQVPDDHADRASNLCQGCHQPTGDSPAGAQSATIPSIPHPLAGRDDCLACHETGLAGATQIPGDHTGRTSTPAGPTIYARPATSLARPPRLHKLRLDRFRLPSPCTPGLRV